MMVKFNPVAGPGAESKCVMIKTNFHYLEFTLLPSSGIVTA